MDSEEYNESQGNDLKDFLYHFNKWWNKYGTQTLLLLLIVVAGVVAIRWYKGKDARERDAAWTDFAGTSSPEGLQEIADRYADRPGLAGYALLRASDQLGEQALDGSIVNTVGGTPSKNNAKRLLERSIALAKRTIAAPQATEPSLVKLNARLRLAADYETLGQWALAKEQYKALRKEAGAYKMLATVANLRLNRMASIEQPVQLPQAPPPPKAKTPEKTKASTKANTKANTKAKTSTPEKTSAPVIAPADKVKTPPKPVTP